jgi:hypothetical protein
MKENNKSSKRKFLAATLGSLIVINTLALCGYSVVKLGDSSANISSSDITQSFDDLDDETESAVKEQIKYVFDNRLTEQEGFADFNISTDVLLDLASEVIDENPQYFYLSAEDLRAAYSSNFLKETGIKWAKKLKVTYPENVQEQIDFVSSTADEIISGIDDTMSDVDKALYVHDYLALNFSYDVRVHDNDPETVRGLYDFFQQKTGVCYAYTIAYQYIMQYKLGIPTVNVSSYEMGHTWNAIQIDGQWYHVDVTWDDPEPNRVGCVMHNYFLLSDSAMSSETGKHYNWVYGRNKEVSCYDTTYDNYWWRDISTQMFRMDGAWYSVDGNGQFTAKNTNGEIVNASSASFTVEKDTWYVWNSTTSFWKGNYTTLIKYGDVFFYNTTENVYVINTDGSDKRLVASFPKADHNGYQIFGMGINENNELYVSLQNNPQDVTDENGNLTLMDVQIIVVGNMDTIQSSAVSADNNNNNSNQTQNWDEISASLEQNNSVEITIDTTANNEPVSLPASVVESAKGKDVDIVINIGSYQWTVNGLNISDDAEVADVNLGVSENEGIVPEEITNKYVDEQQTVEVNLEHEGQFGYTANLKVYIGTEYAGMMASVLHYDAESDRLAYQETVPVDDEGYAVLNFQHASSYMVVIDNKAVGLPGDINNDGKATVTDYVEFKQYLVGSVKEDDSTIKLVNVDMDGDNQITIRDAVLLSKELVK